MKNFIAAVLSFLLMSAAFGEPGKFDPSIVVPKLAEKLGRPVSDVRLLDNPRVYEVVVGGKFLYVDTEFRFAFSGPLLDLDKKRDKTSQRVREITAAEVAKLPLDSAIIRIQGSGKTPIFVFADPNCRYCKELEPNLAHLKDVTIYIYPLGFLSEDSLSLAKDIWCADDRRAAWDQWMLQRIKPKSNHCDAPNEKNLKIAQNLKITSTPTILFADGRRLMGLQSVERLQQHIHLTSSTVP